MVDVAMLYDEQFNKYILFHNPDIFAEYNNITGFTIVYDFNGVEIFVDDIDSYYFKLLNQKHEREFQESLEGQILETLKSIDERLQRIEEK